MLQNGSWSTVISPRSTIERKNAVERVRGALHNAKTAMGATYPVVSLAQCASHGPTRRRRSYGGFRSWGYGRHTSAAARGAPGGSGGRRGTDSLAGGHAVGHGDAGRRG